MRNTDAFSDVYIEFKIAALKLFSVVTYYQVVSVFAELKVWISPTSTALQLLIDCPSTVRVQDDPSKM